MLPVKSVRNPFLFVDAVQNPIRVVLHRSCEDHNLVELRHLGQKLVTARPDSKLAFALFLVVMDQSLVQVKNEAVTVRILCGWQVWRIRLRQNLVPANSCASDAIKRWKDLFGSEFEILDCLACFDDSVTHLDQLCGFDLLQNTGNSHKQRAK